MVHCLKGCILERVKYLLSLLKLNMSGPKVRRRGDTHDKNEKLIKLEENKIESPVIVHFFLSFLF